MNLIRYIAFPLVPVYFMVTWLRNTLYDLNIKTSKSYPFPVICVGNLSVGGTGKTPMIEYLIHLLKDHYKLATLSRGYKRQTTGFQLADATASAVSIGDEPFQFYNKFKGAISVAVDANRQNGIHCLRQITHAPEVILLDDAFQHRKVKAGINILLTTYANPFYSDFVLPTGNLREPKSGAKRAHIIVVTKCPKAIGEAEKNTMIKRIAPRKHQHVFFSAICYADAVVSQNTTIGIDALPHFTLVTGIANSKPLVDFLNEKRLSFEHLNFKDHHEFSQADINVLEKRDMIVTTEKDFMRLSPYKTLEGKLFYLPISIKIDDSAKLETLIRDFVKS